MANTWCWGHHAVPEFVVLPLTFSYHLSVVDGFVWFMVWFVGWTLHMVRVSKEFRSAGELEVIEKGAWEWSLKVRKRRMGYLQLHSQHIFPLHWYESRGHLARQYTRDDYTWAPLFVGMSPQGLQKPSQYIKHFINPEEPYPQQYPLLLLDFLSCLVKKNLSEEFL